jgi:hypothetical protein
VALVTAKMLNDESFRQRIELKMSFFNFVTGGKSFGLQLFRINFMEFFSTVRNMKKIVFNVVLAHFAEFKYAQNGCSVIFKKSKLLYPYWQWRHFNESNSLN